MSKTGSKENSKRDTTDPSSPLSDSDGGGYVDTLSRHSNFSSYADYTSRDVSEEIDDDEPPLSERVATYREDDVSHYLHALCFSCHIVIFLCVTRITRRKCNSTKDEVRAPKRRTMMKLRRTSVGAESE